MQIELTPLGVLPDDIAEYTATVEATCFLDAEVVDGYVIHFKNNWLLSIQFSRLHSCDHDAPVVNGIRQSKTAETAIYEAAGRWFVPEHARINGSRTWVNEYQDINDIIEMCRFIKEQ